MFVNRDNLGGYKLGSSGGDAVIQAFTHPSMVSKKPMFLSSLADHQYRRRVDLHQWRNISA